MDFKKYDEYISTLSTDDLMKRYNNENKKWNEECVQLCYFELVKRGALRLETSTNGGVIRADIEQYNAWMADEDYINGEKLINSENYEEARICFEKAANKNNAPALTQLATIYYHGNGSKINFEKAYNYFEKAMKFKYPVAADWIADMYRMGKYVAKDKEKARKIHLEYKTALLDLCINGDRYAQYMYGFDQLHGTFSEANKKEGILWLQKAAENGLFSAQVEIAKSMLKGQVYQQDIKKGIQILSDICNMSHSKKAHYELAKSYYSGEYVEQDYSEAFRLFMVAAEQGHILSQSYIGDMYYWGEGVEKNYAEARKWYELAAEYNEVSSLKQLGFIYYYGEDTTKNDDKAFECFKLAADLGNARSQYMLHWFYFSDGKYTDYKLGKEYIEKAAEAGDILAQKKLGRLYVSEKYGFADDNKFFEWMMEAAKQQDAEAERIVAGAYMNQVGTEKNVSEALQWYERAVEHGDGQAAYELAELYISGDYVSQDTKKGIELLNKAENLLSQCEDTVSDDYCCVAELYEEFSEKEMLQKALDNYCRAYNMDDDKNALVHIAMLYFLYGLNMTDISESELSIIHKLESIAKESESSLPYCVLGDIYYYGHRSIETDEKVGAQWYQLAYKKGSMKAGCKLALYYMTKAKEHQKGFELLFDIDNNNYHEAAYWLGLCYKKGIYVHKNDAKAKRYLKKAAKLGDENAVKELEDLLP